MPAKFLETFANHGVDETITPPGMIVPLHGSNFVALTGGKDLRPVLDSKIKHIKIIEVDQAIFNVARLMSDVEPAVVPLPADARIFQIDSDLPVKTDVIAGHARLTVRVLKQRLVKIAVRPVQVRDKNGTVVFHSQRKRKLDIPELVKAMNQIWTVQANVVFELVSADPILVEDEAIAKALNLKAERAPLPEVVNMIDFVEMFDGFKDKNAEMTFFLFGKVGDRKKGEKGQGLPVGGATIPPISPIVAFISDLRTDSTMAHEAGHLLGYSGHVDPANARQLMNEGGPGDGLGKILFNDLATRFNL